jgi:hypothetical protein
MLDEKMGHLMTVGGTFVTRPPLLQRGTPLLLGSQRLLSSKQYP